MKASRLFGQHILSASQFTRWDLDLIFKRARTLREMPRRKRRKLLRDIIVTDLFYEASTRTSSSFEAAVKSLGGNVIAINGVQYSSVSKGETLEDTVRTLQSYSDLIVLRHGTTGAAERAARFMSKPLINAGDGQGEHPTQALLDIFTVTQELGDLEGLTVTMVGDLRRGRTVHALAKLLSLYRVRLRFVSPRVLAMPEEVKTYLRDHGTPFEESHSLQASLSDTDVLYMTRIQKERPIGNPEEDEAIRNAPLFIVNRDLMERSMKKRMIIMHPFPRNEEIALDVDADPRAAYFRQIENGLYIRMALLTMVLGTN